MADAREMAAGVRLAVFDIDGVFTDGRIWMGTDGTEFKAFCVRDGVGVKQLLAAGIEIAIISGRASSAVDRRMAELGVAHVMQGVRDKGAALAQLLHETGVEPAHVAYLGDDTPDLPAMQAVGLPAAVADAHPEVRAAGLWIASLPGGSGAVREFCEFLLGARG